MPRLALPRGFRGQPSPSELQITRYFILKAVLVHLEFLSLRDTEFFLSRLAVTSRWTRPLVGVFARAILCACEELGEEEPTGVPADRHG